MSVRAGIVVTGTEVLGGRVVDRNGPWLADRLRELGVDLAQITIVGDRPADMLAALRWCESLGVELIVTSGGLGPTADDMTAAVVAEFCGREMFLDEALEGRIREILRPMSARWPNLDIDAIHASNRKQALVPVGATVLEPIGTAPGLIVTPVSRTPTVVVLPGPPRELQPMWADAVGKPAFVGAIAGATTYTQTMLRLFGLPESEIAATLRVATGSGVDLERLEVTTCLRRGEVEIVTRYEPQAADIYAAFERVVRERHADTLFSDDGSTVDEQVARLLVDAGLSLGVAESCTGGLLAGRLTDLAGASAYFDGGVVAYSNDVKTRLADVPSDVIDRFGAVSEEVAVALADGARSSLRTSVGVGVTGVAGPCGGTPDKPVGLVWIAASTADGRRLTRRLSLGGGRADIRDRTTTHALHLLRRLLLLPKADASGPQGIDGEREAEPAV
ncbi:MAG TPA: competence/damage-inducible protein A [Solirubrobacteraceae bacterium]|jgi:nicotinamide-nucleotide amidase|nr:competence/damage-inducible protein A [Solirubrobacteraceae bacterium]